MGFREDLDDIIERVEDVSREIRKEFAGTDDDMGNAESVALTGLNLMQDVLDEVDPDDDDDDDDDDDESLSDPRD